MPLEDAKEFADEHVENKSAGDTNVRVDATVINQLKREVGVGKNSEIAPVVAAACAAYLGDEDAEEQYMEQFKEQFQDDN